MKYGINLLLWTDDATDKRLLPLFEQIKEIGYDGVEVPIFSYDLERYAALGRTLDHIGLERTAVTVRSEQDDPISSDPAVRARAVEVTKHALDCCAVMGATHLVGPLHSALGGFSGALPTLEEHRRAAECMRKVADYAADRGVMLALEYLNRFELYLLNSAVDMAAFLDEVDHPSCRMMYDTFHAHIEEKSPRQAIRAGGKKIVHVHISENDRSTPGTGQVKWADTFDGLAEIGYDGWMTVEAFGLALPSLVAATKIWRRMYDTEEKLVSDALAFMKSEWSARECRPALQY